MSRNRFKYPKFMDTYNTESGSIFVIKIGRNRYINVAESYTNNNLSYNFSEIYDGFGNMYPKYDFSDDAILDVIRKNKDINSYLNRSFSEGFDELDTYSELLSYGYTVAQIRKYCGNEMGTHMEIFCRTHGLL